MGFDKKGSLISYRPDIKVMDCTIRDGGLVNDFYFEDDFVRELYHTCIKTGVDYMEFGYKASKAIFSDKEFGKWKFCTEADIRSIVGENNTDLKISIMADIDRTNFREDVIDRKDSVIDMIRVATYINQIPSAIEMINDFNAKGYETTVNIMALSHVNDHDLMEALELLSQTGVDVIYLVDSFGTFYPEQIRDMAERYLIVGDKAGKKIGIHAHNNQQLAFANTIEALTLGVSFIDSTVNSLGRGAGNCPTELLLSFLKNPKYNIEPLLVFIKEHIVKLKENGLVWGYDIPYLLTGILNRHPSSAINFIKEGKNDYTKFHEYLLDNG
ncbi:MAG: aldolase catalytic domain-containing protein [Vallitaleaceae bacterium]|jgi:4-hydroxy 2-oxovalerate aldolase|nr:aldolase catalytic domain-containing protein [Vallitaleaceae bacterium]